MRKEVDKIGNVVHRDQMGFARLFQYEIVEGCEMQTGVGLVDMNDNEVLPCIYTNVLGFYNDSPLCVVEQNGKWGYINKQLITASPVQYDYADSDFYCGLALVERMGKYGYIDAYGHESIKCQYDKADIFWDNIAGVSLNGRWGIIDHDGRTTIPFHYDYASVLGSERIMVGIEKKYGIIDYRGREIVPIHYDALSHIHKDGRIEYKIGHEHGFMDLNGSDIMILPF